MLTDTKRDTDRDWRTLGQTDPYWAVLSHDDYRNKNLTPERLDAFYATGAEYIDQIADWLVEETGKPPSGRALDFGCGVGRLAEAMTAYASEVTGCDVSPGMLALARDRSGKVNYVEALAPAAIFDWINSYIVFQHIPPERGLAIVEDLLSRLSPDGVISLQFACWRDDNRKPPEPKGWRGVKAAKRYYNWLNGLAPGLVLMYDYDLSAIVKLLNQAGIRKMRMVSTNHDGHHGVIILARRSA